MPESGLAVGIYPSGMDGARENDEGGRDGLLGTEVTEGTDVTAPGGGSTGEAGITIGWETCGMGRTISGSGLRRLREPPGRCSNVGV